MSAPALRLVGAHGPVEIRDRALLGRDETCDVVLADRSISRRHAAVEWDGERWIIQDLDSANGVFVQKRRVKAAELNSGSDLLLGSLTFRVEIEVSQPEDDPGATRLTLRPNLTVAPRITPAAAPEPAAVAPVASLAEADDAPAGAGGALPELAHDDAADLPAAQPVLSVEALAEPARPSPARTVAPAAAGGGAAPSPVFLAWFVPNVLLAALALYFVLAAQKSGGERAAIEAEAEKAGAERSAHMAAGAALAEGAPEALVLCNGGSAPVHLAWLGALYRQGDESIRNFNSDYCPDEKLPTLAPGASIRFRSTRERPAECRWDGARPLAVAWRPSGTEAGFRLVRLAELQGRCLDVSQGRLEEPR